DGAAQYWPGGGEAEAQVSRALAYCGFKHTPQINLPTSGVQSAPVRVIDQNGLGLLWSEVEWPFDPARMKDSAVEFHGVVHHVFGQTAVIPFRLLSVFEDEQALQAFVDEQHADFLSDLERLKDFVQMECVVFPSPTRAEADRSSGKAYLE